MLLSAMSRFRCLPWGLLLSVMAFSQTDTGSARRANYGSRFMDILLMMTRRVLLPTLAAPLFAAPRKIEVIAHRGEHIECPENTLPAIEKAISLGVDWVELDIRTTRDGKWVSMHNSTVEGTTNGQGAVAEMDFADLVKLDAGAKNAKYPGTPVPSFDQALETIGRRCGLYLDAKQITAPAILDHLRRHKMLDRCVVYGGLSLHRALQTLGYAHLSMPEAVSVTVLRDTILKELNPKVIAFDRRDFRDEMIALALEAKKGVFVDRLGSDDTETAWLDAIQRGATGIQTDHPGELVRMLTRRPG